MSDSSKSCRGATWFSIVLSRGCRQISVLVCGASVRSPSFTLMSLKLFLSHFPHSSFSQYIFYPVLKVFPDVTSVSWTGSDVPFNRSTGANWNWLCLTQQHLHYQNLTTVTQHRRVCIEHKWTTVSQKSKEKKELTFDIFCTIFSKQSSATNLCLKRQLLVFNELTSFTRKHKQLGG